ncbi:MAG: nitroreductase [Candidatus Protistobacter heckmanni]|nr:nitroreductase [Candidatus Protistobacter heckmanni]
MNPQRGQRDRTCSWQSYERQRMKVYPPAVTVLAGDAREALSRRIAEVRADPERMAVQDEGYAYYPRTWGSPYLERRRKLGWSLYGLLGIGRGEKAAIEAQMGCNYNFFGAPVGLIFTIDWIMEQGSWLDYGMFSQSVMLAAMARGLDTFPQAAFIYFHRLIVDFLWMDQEKTAVVCGMALGYADPGAVENQLETERAPVSDFTVFVDKK